MILYQALFFSAFSLLLFQILIVGFIQFLYKRSYANIYYLFYLVFIIIKLIILNYSFVGGERIDKLYPLSIYNDISGLFILIFFTIFYILVLPFKVYFPQSMAVLKKKRVMMLMLWVVFIFCTLAIFNPKFNFIRGFIKIILVLELIVLFRFTMLSGKYLKLYEIFVLIGGSVLFFTNFLIVFFVAITGFDHYHSVLLYYIFIVGIILQTSLFTLGLIYFTYGALLKRTKLESKLKELELLALRAQLNPHFVQNTFDIVALSISKGEKEYSITVLKKVSKYLREVLNSSEERVVTLEDEVVGTENYLNIQQIINPGLFEYTINIDENVDTYGAFVPTMILQPIVENCIKHGFKETKSGGLIRVDIKQYKNSISIDVIDNGCGIYDSYNIEQSKGIDITKKRLSTIFGNDGEWLVSIQNRQDGTQGTIFNITIKPSFYNAKVA